MRGGVGKRTRKSILEHFPLRKYLHSDKNLELTKQGREEVGGKEVVVSRKRKEHMQKPWGSNFEDDMNGTSRVQDWTEAITGTKTCWVLKTIYNVLNIILKINGKVWTSFKQCLVEMMVSFITGKNGNNPKCLSIDEWVNVMWYIHTMQYFHLEKSNQNWYML